MASLHIDENTEIGNTGITLKEILNKHKIINNYGMLLYVGTTTNGNKWSNVDIVSSSSILSENIKLYNNRTLNIYNAKTISISFRIQFTSSSYSYQNCVILYVQPVKNRSIINQRTYAVWNALSNTEYSLSDLICNFDGIDYDYVSITLCKYTGDKNDKIITTNDVDNHMTVIILE